MMTFAEWKDLSFADRVLWIDRRMRSDLPQLTKEDRSAISGNGAYESGAFEIMQEIRPTVPGSRGGWGWFQWTGPRRRDFEQFAADHNFALDSPEANYRFLIHELTETWEQRVIEPLINAPDLSAKVRKFETLFERAGVKNYERREEYARRVLEIINNETVSKSVDPHSPIITSPTTFKQRLTIIGSGAIAGIVVTVINSCTG